MGVNWSHGFLETAPGRKTSAVSQVSARGKGVGRSTAANMAPWDRTLWGTSRMLYPVLYLCLEVHILRHTGQYVLQQ